MPVKSCDTNILLYYLNEDCREHKYAREYLEPLFGDNDFAICELVLIELYVLLRNPKVLAKPLGAGEAHGVIDSFRKNPDWAVIDYPGQLMDRIWKETSRESFRRTQIYDSRIAHTLHHHGIKEFATRNPRDFAAYRFLTVTNPIPENL